MSSHAWLAPSAAESWSTCAEYPSLVAGLPRKSPRYSAEGTFAHLMSEWSFDMGVNPHYFIGLTLRIDGHYITCTKEMADFLLPGIDYIRSFGGDFYNERLVNTAEWSIPGQYGHLDRAVITEDLIVISDLKYGAGVPVDVFRNKQLTLYALGFWNDIARHVTSTRDFLIIIDQPRVHGKGGEWECTLDELLEIGEDLKKKAQRTLDEKPGRQASEKGCFFCPVRKSEEGCWAWDQYNFERLTLDIEDLDAAAQAGDKPPLPVDMTMARRAYIAKHIQPIKAWLDEQYRRVLTAAISGEETPGVYASLGNRGQRAWIDTGEAEKLLLSKVGKDRAYTKKIIGPAGLEKIIGKKEFAKLNNLDLKDKSPISGKFFRRSDPEPVLVSDDSGKPRYTAEADAATLDIEDLDSE